MIIKIRRAGLYTIERLYKAQVTLVIISPLQIKEYPTG